MERTCKLISDKLLILPSGLCLTSTASLSASEDEDLQKKNLWKKVAELSTQKVILGILCTLVILPFLQVEGVDYFKSFALVQCVDMYEDARVGPKV